MSAKDLANYLDKRIDELGLSKSEASRRADVSRQTWYRLINADIQDVKLSTLIRLSRALEVHPLVVLKLYFADKDDAVMVAANSA